MKIQKLKIKNWVNVKWRTRENNIEGGRKTKKKHDEAQTERKETESEENLMKQTKKKIEKTQSLQEQK